MILVDYFHPNACRIKQMQLQWVIDPLAESFIPYLLHSFQINQVITLLQRLHHNNTRTVYAPVGGFVSVAVPTINQIDLSHICDASVNPGVFEIYVLAIETDDSNIMTVFEIYWVWSCIIIVLPGLNQDDDRSSRSKILFQKRNGHIFLYFCFETELQDSSMQFLRLCARVFVSQSQFGKVHLSQILFTVVAENCSETGRTTSIVSGLVNIRNIQDRYIFIASLESVVFVIFQNCCIVELGSDRTYRISTNVRGSDDKGQQCQSQYLVHKLLITKSSKNNNK